VYRRARLSRTITLVAALLFSASAFAREFRAADTQSEDYPTVEALRYMGSLVAEGSGGRHRLAVFHSRQLGEEKETLEQTRVGAIDLNRTNVALIGTMVPAVNVLAMPFLFRSIEHLQKVLDGPIGTEILNSFDAYGFVGLAFYDSGARSIYNSVRPIASMADLKGLRIRVQQSEQMSEMIRSLVELFVHKGSKVERAAVVALRNFVEGCRAAEPVHDSKSNTELVENRPEQTAHGAFLAPCLDAFRLLLPEVEPVRAGHTPNEGSGICPAGGFLKLASLVDNPIPIDRAFLASLFQ